jgi:outer membrane protein assembly factor BamB
LPALRSNAVGEDFRVFLGFDYPGSGRLGAVSLRARFDRLRWELHTRGPISSTPAVFQGVVFAASEDGLVYAVTAEDREPVWTTEGGVFRVNAPVRAPLHADDFGLYVPVTDSRFYVLDRASGRIRWQYFAQAPLNEAPFVTDSMVYLNVPGTGVVALDKRRGEYNRTPIWTSTVIRQILGEDDHHVYVRTHDNRLAALNRQTGQEVFATEPTDFTAFAGNPRGSTFYVGRPNGEVLAVRPVLQPGQVGEPIRGGIRRND